MVLISCSSTRLNTGNILFNNTSIIEDYIYNFSKINENDLPFAILISVNEKSNIIIKDVPKMAALGILDEKKVNYCMFTEVLCFYNKDEINLNDSKFYEVPIDLIKMAGEKNIMMFDGIELQISNKFIEWEPTLVIQYNLIKLKKRIID